MHKAPAPLSISSPPDEILSTIRPWVARQLEHFMRTRGRPGGSENAVPDFVAVIYAHAMQAQGIPMDSQAILRLQDRFREVFNQSTLNRAMLDRALDGISIIGPGDTERITRMVAYLDPFFRQALQPPGTGVTFPSQADASKAKLAQEIAAQQKAAEDKAAQKLPEAGGKTPRGLEEKIPPQTIVEKIPPQAAKLKQAEKAPAADAGTGKASKAAPSRADAYAKLPGQQKIVAEAIERALKQAQGADGGRDLPDTATITEWARSLGRWKLSPNGAKSHADKLALNWTKSSEDGANKYVARVGGPRGSHLSPSA